MDIKEQEKSTDNKVTPDNSSVSPHLSWVLILIAFHLAIMVTVYGVSLLTLFVKPDIYFRFQHMSGKVFFILTCIISVFSIVLIISALVAFFSRQYIFVCRYRLFVYSVALISIVDCASLLWFHATGFDFEYRYYDENILFKKAMIVFLHPVFLVCVCIPYLEKSKRVKAIFKR